MEMYDLRKVREVNNVRFSYCSLLRSNLLLQALLTLDELGGTWGWRPPRID